MRMKKFLALLIVMALTASLIPTAFAAEKTTNYNYVFSHSEHNHDSGRSLTVGTHRINNMAENASSPWGFVNAYKFNSLATYSGYLNWTIKDEVNTGVVFAPGEDTVSGVRAALALEISASEGIYDASLSVMENTTLSAPELEVYLIPKEDYVFPVYDSNDVEGSKASFYKSVEAMSANYRIGKIDLYNKSGDVYIGRVGLTEEDYYLVLVPCGVNEEAEIAEGNLWKMQLTNFKLDSAGTEAYSETIENLTSVYKFKNPNDTLSVSTAGGVFNATNIQVRYYGYGVPNAPLAAFGIQVDKSGTYNINFKTDEDAAENSAAPAIYVIEDEGTYKGDTQASTLLGNNSPIGYFNFSTLKASDGYMPVTIDGEKESELSSKYLDSTKKYFIVMYMDADSFYLNDVADTGDLGDDGYAPADGGGIKKGTALLGKSNYQTIRLSGIQLTQVMEPSEEETERQEAYDDDRELYNELTNVTAENNSVNELDGYSSNATVTVVAQDIATGASIVNDVVNENVAVNSKYSPVAPSVGNDYEFMYWAIGLGANRKIVSFDKDEYSFEVAPGRNLVYAVYRKTNNDTKYAFFFDGSKTVLGKKAISAGSVTLPALPGAMPGFGNPTGWKYTGEENENALLKDAVVENLTDDTFFVADYNNKKTVTVTIDGQEFKVPYGTEIKLVDYASIRENKSGENVFNYWKKGDEIISFKPDYTFKAYENCTLTSTYAKYEPINKTVRRIFISADSTTGITFAEFIGLDSAIEKGILFGDAGATYTNANAKAVMQTDGKVFSVVNETGKTAIGYAILEGGSIVYSDR